MEINKKVANNDNKNNVPVFKKNLSTMLMKKGHELVSVESNYKVDGYKVFFFKNTEELQNDIKAFSMEMGRKIFKLKNLKTANRLKEEGFELLNIRTEKDGTVIYIFKHEEIGGESIYEAMVRVRKEIYGD